MQTTSEERRWAEQEFGGARLQDPRRVRRLVQMATQAASVPAGRVTTVFNNLAQREAAYRLLENPQIDAAAIGDAAASACAKRARQLPYVFVPTDGSSLHLCDNTGRKGLGSIGTLDRGAKGLKVLTSQALSPAGVALGLLSQQFWARTKRSPKRPGAYDRRDLKDKETQHWLDAMQQANDALHQQAPQTCAWFQLDREGDKWTVYRFLQQLGALFTIRASSDRRVFDAQTGAPDHLWNVAAKGPVAGGYSLRVPAGVDRCAREAMMVVRATQVVLDLRDLRTGRRHQVPLFAVLTREVGTRPPGEKPIEWLLLTNRPVKTLQDALLVIYGYTQRWRIEQFHNLWKSGACHVEDTQLRAVEPVCKWARVLASVAVRIEKMIYLSRSEPDLPATVEFTQAEIDAAILLREPKGVKPGATPTVSQVVRWVADLGGYTGKSSGGPPGPKVLTRGMHHLMGLAQVLSKGKLVANE